MILVQLDTALLLMDAIVLVFIHLHSHKVGSGQQRKTRELFQFCPYLQQIGRMTVLSFIKVYKPAQKQGRGHITSRRKRIFVCNFSSGEKQNL